MPDRRADYAVVSFDEHLGPDPDGLAVPWAEFVGDRTSPGTFQVSTDAATDAYVELQAFDVGEWGHEIRLNDRSLSGFDLPPGDGWQYWMDTLSGSTLAEGENTLRVARDTAGNDAFVVGTAVVHWRAPVE